LSGFELRFGNLKLCHVFANEPPRNREEYTDSPQQLKDLDKSSNDLLCLFDRSKMILLLVGVVLVGAAIYHHLNMRRLAKVEKVYSGPPALPIVGNGLAFLSNSEGKRNVVSVIKTSYQTLWAITS
jgi:hypothetical protein